MVSRISWRDAWLGRMPRWDECHAGTDASLGRMPHWDECHAGKDATLGRMPRSDGCLAGTDATLGRMLRWDGCHTGTDASLGRMPHLLCCERVAPETLYAFFLCFADRAFQYNVCNLPTHCTNSCFIISLLYSSTCFEHYCAHHH